MNGIEALNDMTETFDCGGYHSATIGCKDGAFKEVFSEELSIIKRELKVNKILKKKKVNLALLSEIASNPEYKTAIVYNTRRRDWALVLTEEETQLIVDWLKEV